MANLVSTLSVGVAAGIVFFGLWVLLRRSAAHFGQIGEGLLGFSSVVALVIGAWLYFQSGRDRARVEVRIVPTVVPLPPDSRSGPRVLLQLAGTVTNRGEYTAELDCVAVDVRGFRLAGELTRNGVFHYDVNTEPLLTETAAGPQWDRCIDREHRRWDAQERDRLAKLALPSGEHRDFRPTNSGHRYDPFRLLPGEVRTVDLELVVPCTYAALRIHFVVPKPDEEAVHEAKTVQSLLEPCNTSQAGALSSQQRRREARRQRSSRRRVR